MKKFLDRFHNEGLAFLLLLLFFVLSPILVAFILFDYFGFDRQLSVLVYFPYILALSAYLFNQSAGIFYKVFFYLHLAAFIGVSFWYLPTLETGQQYYFLIGLFGFLSVIGCVFALFLLTHKADESI